MSASATAEARRKYPSGLLSKMPQAPGDETEERFAEAKHVVHRSNGFPEPVWRTTGISMPPPLAALFVASHLLPAVVDPDSWTTALVSLTGIRAS